MDPAQLLYRLDGMIRSHSILCHPFYLAWERGELSRGQLATYARVYYPHVAAFPGHLQTAMQRTVDPQVRDELSRNLTDERTEPASHHELWLDFAEAMGEDRSVVAAVSPHPAAADMIANFRRLAERDTASALAAFYAYESQQPEVSLRKMEGLRKHYGVSEEKGLAYFEVHARMDREHRQGERAALGRCLDAGATAASVLGAADDALRAYWALLDGICAEGGITIAEA